MKIVLILMIILLTASLFRCLKKTEDSNSNQVIGETLSQKEKPLFDYAKTMNRLQKIKQLNLESFVLVTILHKEFIADLQQEFHDNTMDQDFYQRKNAEFFGQFLFSQSEYNKFLKDNREELNSYIENHPEFLKIIGDL